jgi:hypothetical protein
MEIQYLLWVYTGAVLGIAKLFNNSSRVQY